MYTDGKEEKNNNLCTITAGLSVTDPQFFVFEYKVKKNLTYCDSFRLNIQPYSTKKAQFSAPDKTLLRSKC